MITDSALSRYLLPAGISVLLILGFGSIPVSLHAQTDLPQAAAVVHGSVDIETTNTDMTVRQGTDTGIINWDSFNVGNGFGVHFDNGAGATLNRVTGAGGSFIDGSLTATGSLFLLNPNGVIIGENGQVLTGGSFLATTMEISNEEFLNGGGFSLLGNGEAGIVNLGQIVSSGGNVVLAGYTVRNEGSITAADGQVGLLAGTRIDVLADLSWMGGAYAVSLGERGNDITNVGRIEAMIAELRTHNGNIYALAGNTGGMIQATGVETEGGRVVLTAENGLVESSGTIIATNGENGGSIEIAASEVHNFGGLQDVSGARGGSIKITTDNITSDTAMRADGSTGAGGEITIDAHGQVLLTSAGEMSADGATQGGVIAIGAGESGSLIHSGSLSADGGLIGGEVALLGANVALLAGDVSATGATKGGSIHLGGGFQGGAIWTGGEVPFDYANAQSVYVSDRSVVSADATVAGDGGQLILWSDGTTQFYGELSAREGAAGGIGGLIETSGLQGLGGDGVVDAGQGGEWLQDPRNIIIDGSTDAVTEFQRLISPVPAGGQTADREAQNYTSGIGLNFGSAIDIDGDTFVIGGAREGVSTSFPNMGVYIFENGAIAARLSSAKGATDQADLGDVAVVGDYVAFSTNHSIFDGTTYNGMVHFFSKGDGWQNGSSNLFGATHGYAASDNATFADYSNSKLVGFKSPSSASGSAEFALALPTADSGTLVDAGMVSFFQVSANGGTPSVSLAGIVQGDSANQQAGYYLTASDDNVFIGYHYNSSLKNTLRYGDSGYALNNKTLTTATAFDMAAAASGSLAGGDLTLALRTNSQFNIFELEKGVTGDLSIKEEGTFQSPNFAGFLKDIAYSGDTLLVGAPTANNFGGGALFFREPAAGWGTLTSSGSTYAPELVINGNGAFQPSGYQTFNGQLGAAVALDGDTALLGMPTWHGGNFASSGGGAQDSAVGEVRSVSRNPDGTWTNAYTIGLRPASAITPTDTTSSFGQAVAIDGTTYAVSDPNRRVADVDVGAVYLYENGALAATILGGQGGFGNSFGTKLDLSGDTLAIGRGSSVILVERDAGWRNLGGGIVYSSSPNPLSFVSGVSDFSLDGNFLAIGNASAGEVSIYENTVSSWATTVAGAKSTVSRPTAADSNFGSAVALSGNSLAVYDGSYPGNVFMFENLLDDWATSTGTQLIRTGSLADDTLDFQGRFGSSLSLEWNTLAVGFGLGATTVEHANTRGAYVYERSTTWADAAAPVARLTAPGGEDFGALVAVDADMIVVTEGWRISSSVNQGGDTAYIFKRQGGWREGDANLISSLATSYGGGLQYGLAIDNGNILIGGEDLLAAAFNESVSVFTGPFLLNQRAAFGVNDALDLRISAGMIANSLSFGTNITLQANNDISVLSPITVDNPSGDGGDLTFEAGRSILVNAGITTDNGNLTLLADSANANATHTSSGEAVVVLGENVELNLGTGDLLINAADRFENRTGDTSPFVFDGTNPGNWLIFAQTPANTGAPDLANLGNDLDIIGRNYLYYGLNYDPTTPRPSSLPSGNGYVYAVQPSITVGVGDSTITYGQTPTATLSLEGVTLDSSAVDAAQFGISQSDLINLVDAGIASSVPTSSSGFANAGTYPGAVTGVAKTTVTSGGVYGVAVATGGAGDLTVNKATLDARPDDSTRVYRSTDPTFTATYTGFVTGDSAADLDTPVSLTSDATSASDVGVYTLSAGAGLDDNYLFNFTGTGQLTITAMEVAISGLSGVNKVYDATSAADFTGTPTINTFAADGVTLGGTLTATASFADANVGTGKVLTLAGFTLSGNAAKIGNYTLTIPSNILADITPLALNVTGLTALDKIYDATTTTQISGTAGVTALGSDVLAVAGTPTGVFDDKNVGSDKPVTVSGLTLTGTAASNYILESTTALAADITPLQIEVTGVSAVDKVYDATTGAALTGTPTIAVITGDVVTLAGTVEISFDDKNAGTDKPVVATGYTLSGTDAGNYTLDAPTGLKATVTPAPVVVTGVTGVNREYDATTTVSLDGTPTITPLSADDLVVIGNPVATISDKDAGTGKTVAVSGYTLSGADAVNYTIVQPTAGTVDVAPRPIAISAVTVNDKVYDATTAATSTGTAAVGGILAGDNATIDAAALAFTFVDKNVGVNKSVTVSGITVNGTDAGNYVANAAVFSASISPAMLQLTGVLAGTKTYDGTALTTLTGGSLSGIQGSDTVGINTTGAAGTFADKNVGTNKSVTAAGYALTGDDVANYVLTQPTGLMADISAFVLQLADLNTNKTYDGTTAAPFTFSGLDSLFFGDDVTVDSNGVSASYADKNAGAAKPVAFTGTFGLIGTDAANYTLTQPTGLTSAIAQLEITLSGLAVTDRIYDATATGQFASIGSLNNVVTGDDLTIDSGAMNLIFSDANAGEAKTVTLSGVALAGADAGNYTAITPTGLTATISPKSLTVDGATAQDRVYDSTSLVAVSGGSLQGVIGSDAVSLVPTAAAGHLADKTIGTHRAVTVTGYDLTGGAAPNYVLVQPTGLTASITAYILNLLGFNADKTYDGTTVAPLAFTGLDAVFTGDTVAVDASTVTGSYNDKNVATAKPVTVAGTFGLSGSDAGNYVLAQPGPLTGDISRLGITVSGLTIADKIYDGTDIGAIDGTGTFGGAIAGDDLSIAVGAVGITFADKNVGENKDVALSGITLSGADAGNYTAATPVGITGTITPKDLSITGVTATNRVYDQTTQVAINGGTLQGAIATDTVGLDPAAATGTLADKNAGENKSVTVAGFGLTGLDATNYVLAQPTGIFADISAFTLNLLGLNADKVYDGLVDAPLTFTGLDAVFSGDDAAVDTSAVSGRYADKNVGDGKAVTITGTFGLSGTDASNYTLTQPGPLTGDLTPLGISVTGLVIADKTYDATNLAEIANHGSFVGAVTGDEIAVDPSQMTITFADKNAGEGKAVTFSSLALSGVDAGNYTTTTPIGLSATIAVKSVSIDGLSATDKVYDRNAVAALDGTAVVNGFVAGDSVALNATAQAATFVDKHVGTAKIVNVSGLALDGLDATNYIFNAPILTATITAAEVNLIGLTALDRIYNTGLSAGLDGTATLDFGGLTGVLDSLENVTLAGTATGSFADKNVGSAKPVTLAGVTLAGADAANYTFIVPTLSASIGQAELLITGTAVAGKVYDATTTAALATLGGVAPLGSDDVTLTGLTVAFGGKNVGGSKSATATNAQVSGTDTANYQLVLPTGLTAAITPATLQLSGVNADDRVYDGTVNAPLSGSLGVSPLGGDNVSIAGRATATFADKSVGTAKPVTLSGLNLAGSDAGNYTLSFPSLTADVLRRTLTLSGIAVNDKTYDGTVAANLTGGAVLGNAITGDNLAFDLSSISGVFANANAGIGKAVTLSGVGLTGADAGNYTTVLPQGLMATVLQKLLAVIGAEGTDRIYDATTAVAVSGGALSGVVTGDTVNLVATNAAGTMTNKNAGIAKPVSVTGFAISGEGAGNYTVAQPTNVTADITPLDLSVAGIQIADKFFDGTTTATPSGGALQGIISGDDLNLDRSAVTANFDTAAVGQDKPVAVAGLALGGADANNYRLPATLPSSGRILQTLATITDVVPVEVLQATAAEARESERAALRAIADAAANAVDPVDYESQTANLVSGLPPLDINPAMRNLNLGYPDPQVNEYLAAADEAQSTQSSYLVQAESLRVTTRQFKNLAQALNTATRDAEVAQGLVETLQTQIATVNNEIETLEQNLASIEAAKNSITDLQQKIADANRLGRGAEVAQYQTMLAEAQAIVDAEVETRAALDALQTERADSESRLTANTETIARAADLKREYDATKASVLAQKTGVTAAKSAAETAAAKLDAARDKGEAFARGEIENVEGEIAELKGRNVSKVTAIVAAQYGDQSLVELRQTGVSFSPDQQTEMSSAYDELSSDVKTWQALEAQEAAAQATVDSIPYSTRRDWEEAARVSGVRNMSSDEIATMDLNTLGLPDEQLLQDGSPPVKNLDRATDTLAAALQTVGPIKNAIVGDVTIDLSDKIDPLSPRGITDIDTPLTFDAGTEFALKMELQNVGILPRFQNQALADLPVSQQLQLKSAMEATAQRQQDLIAGGMSPDEAAKEAIDDKTMELVTMALFEKFDTYGVGNIPGVQDFVGTALGELSAQFGVDPGGMVINLANGDFRNLLGSADDAVKAVTERYVEVVTDPVGAGVHLASDIGNAAKAGGEAVVNALTGGGGGQSEAQRVAAAEAAFAARQDKLNVLSSALLEVETRRQEAVVAREVALNQVRTMLVTQAEGAEAQEARFAMGNLETLEAARDAAVADREKELYLEALVARQTPIIESSNQADAQRIAELEAGLETPKAKLEAFTGGGK